MYLKKFLKFIFNRAKSLHLKKLFFSHKAREQKGGEREMAKKSMTPSERREAILKVLCQRRQDKIDNLAFEFGVSVRTIKNDIEELSLSLIHILMKMTASVCLERPHIMQCGKKRVQKYLIIN